MHSGIFCADIGTSSLKAAFITEEGTVVTFIRRPFPRPVQAVDWVRAFFSAFSSLPADCDIRAICVSGNGPSLVAVPRSRTRPAAGISGNPEESDSAADLEISRRFSGFTVHSSFTIDEIIERSKNDTLFLWNEPLPKDFSVPAGHSLFLPRIAAFRSKYPQVFEDACLLFSGPEYISYLLTGRAVTVLPDPRYEAAYWNKEELARFGTSVLHTDAEKTIPLLPPFAVAGEVLGTFCKIPVIAGVPDFIAALIGTGTLIPGTACDRAGSSEGLNVCIPQPCRSEGALLLPSIISELWNLSFVIPSSGTAFSAFLISHGFSGNDYTAAMERIAAEPFRLSNPYPATFGGQGRAFVESLAFRIRHGCDLLEQASGVRPVYTLSGGQAHNTLWCRMKAEMTGRTFALPHFADAELLGDAALALYGLGTGSNLAAIAQRLIRIRRYYEPASDSARRYTEKYETANQQPRRERRGMVFS